MWWIEAVVGMGVLLSIQYAIKKIVSKFGVKRAKSATDWRHRLGVIIHPPLVVIIWTVGIVYVLEILGHQFHISTGVAYLHPLRGAIVIVSLVWVWFRWQREFQKAIFRERKTKWDMTTLQVVGRLSTIAVLLVAGVLLLHIFGLNIAPLVALGSIGAASLGFAGKDVIANFCSGFILHITRPFVVGDTVHLPEKDLEGVIEEIGWFRTLMRDKDKRTVYLPNNFFSTQLLVNDSRATHRRLKHTLRVPFEHAKGMDVFVQKVKNLLKGSKEVDHHLPSYVYFSSYGEQACEVEIDAYAKALSWEEFYAFQERFLLQVYNLLEESKIELARFEVQVKQG